MTDAGKYRHLVTVQRFDGTQDDPGGYAWDDGANWDDVAAVKAAIDPVSGREFYEGRQAGSEISHKIRMRYTDRVRAGDRVLWNGHTFHVEAVIDWGMKGEQLLLMCREVV